MTVFPVVRSWAFILAFCLLSVSVVSKGEEQGSLVPYPQEGFATVKTFVYDMLGRPDASLLTFRLAEYAAYQLLGIPWFDKHQNLQSSLSWLGGVAGLAIEAQLMLSSYNASKIEHSDLMSSARRSGYIGWHFGQGNRLVIYPKRGFFTDPNLLGDIGSRLAKLGIERLHMLPVMMLGRPMLMIMGQYSNGKIMEPSWFDPLEKYPHRKWVWIEKMGVDDFLDSSETPISMFSGFIINGVIKYLEGSGNAVENLDFVTADHLTLEDRFALNLGMQTAEGKYLYLMTNKKHSKMWLVASDSLDILSVLKTDIVDSHLSTLDDSICSDQLSCHIFSYVMREYWHLIYLLVMPSVNWHNRNDTCSVCGETKVGWFSPRLPCNDPICRSCKADWTPSRIPKFRCPTCRQKQVKEFFDSINKSPKVATPAK